MPNEIRRLAFTHGEATQALRDYGQRFKVYMPDGKVLHARFANPGEGVGANSSFDHSNIFKTYNVKKNKSNVIITFYDEGSFEHKYYNLTADFITAALIQYCLGNDIMLPKSARKTLDVTDFNICLDMEMSIATDQQEAPLSLEDD